MLRQLTTKKEDGFDWIDLTNPTKEELETVAKEYNLHPTLVKDSLQPEHLPKFETVEDTNFLIFRIHSNKEGVEAGTFQELTNKIAVFYATDFIITIHRKKQEFTDHLVSLVKSRKLKTTHYLVNALIRSCLFTYEVASHALSKEIDYYEEQVFLRNRKVSLLKGLYVIKRKVDLIRRLLILSFDIIDHIDTEEGDVYTRDTRDLYIKQQNMYDTVSDNINQLLNVYFSTSAQKTNEIMRVLTIFSVFFMPLTFIVGIYGMNFEFMPELEWKLGYPSVMIIMAFVTIAIYIWFRRKGWL
jgi:magnesium transporter